MYYDTKPISERASLLCLATIFKLHDSDVHRNREQPEVGRCCQCSAPLVGPWNLNPESRVSRAETEEPGEATFKFKFDDSPRRTMALIISEAQASDWHLPISERSLSTKQDFAASVSAASRILGWIYTLYYQSP